MIDWIDSVFDYTGSEMCGLDWGDLYRRFHNNAYSKEKVSERVATLLEDTQVTDRKGIFEYILGGEENPILLNIRVFDQKTKKAVYLKQTKAAQEKENPIVLYVHWDMMPTPNASTKKLRWMRIMLPPGARGARLTSKIARCSAEHIITPKETGDYL